MSPFVKSPLSFLQYVFIIAGIQIGIAILSIPREMARFAGTDGWIAIVLGWLITSIPSLLTVQIMKGSPDGTILDLIKKKLGRWLAIPFALVFAAYLGGMAYIGLLRTLLIIRVWLLQNTSPFIVLVLLFIPTYIVTREGTNMLGRFAEAIFYFLCWLPFIYLLPLKEGQWLNIIPILKEGWLPILSAVPTVLFAYLGFIAVFFLYPHLTHKKHAGAGVLLANTITMMMNLLITLVCFVYFSPSEMIEVNQPVISVLKTIQFKFLERIEIIFISLYIGLYSLSWIPALYFMAYCLKWTTNGARVRSYLIGLLAFIGIGTYFYLPTFNQSVWLEYMMTRIGIVVEYILPIVIWIYLVIREKVRREEQLG
ncbi:spore germination protein (amino acid permease) [Paenibacillus cellulosilyticus]|uniref:Spore germination protein (Amino acid permease) n=1 Tax=Paenibacillus cellulosilyticus TaxID=375489 RepID=A0A2V2YYS8_9BACL|nr:endospore germination permease [Paenibacillus cellulosilyticus]PWW06576.1 spore germination protein (amino acid permease) [Paenibacillus cellulosilyticus]QKS46092.1 endospore germination permease [Paenibacillus cellulosilyticus]